MPFNGNKYIKNRKDFSCEIIHEIGHSLAARESDFWDKFRNKFELDEEEIATQLTYNALMNNNEFFAEAFADYVINQDKASRIGKEVPKFLKEQGIIQ